MIKPPVLGTLEAALYATDLDAAEAFYSGVIGLKIVMRQPGRHVFFYVGGSILLIFNPDATARPAPPEARIRVPTHGTKGPGHYCFSVSAETLAAWRGHLESAGVEIAADVLWPNGARSIYVRDPAGNSVEFAEPALWF